MSLLSLLSQALPLSRSWGRAIVRGLPKRGYLSIIIGEKREGETPRDNRTIVTIGRGGLRGRVRGALRMRVTPRSRLPARVRAREAQRILPRIPNPQRAHGRRTPRSQLRTRAGGVIPIPHFQSSRAHVRAAVRSRTPNAPGRVSPFCSLGRAGARVPDGVLHTSANFVWSNRGGAATGCWSIAPRECLSQRPT